MSALKKIGGEPQPAAAEPPFNKLAPALADYRAKGHRQLDAKTYETKCSTCVWGCRMPVEITIDQWNPRVKRYRFETFCYGRDDCSFYRPGPKRVVPGRKGKRHVEVIEDREVRRG